MAYDPVTGEYTEDDSSVEKRMTGLLSKDNQYMQQAETVGRKAANRRGLLNSSMAVSAVEDSRIKAALPIASQDASQAHQSNLTGRNLQMSDIQNQRGITSQETMQGRDIESREAMQGRDITSRETMQGRDIEAQNERLIMELGSRQALQEAELAARREMQGEELSSRERIALDNLRAAQERLGMQIESTEALAGLDRELRERLTQMDLASGDLRAAASLAQGYENAYSNMIAGIMANPEIPAAERQRYMDHAARIRDSNLNMLEQFFNVDLTWTAQGGTNTDYNVMGRTVTAAQTA